MSSQAYQGSAKRTFEQAIEHLLATEYSLVGSGRILQLLAGDIKALAETFYPPATRLRPGWMVFTGIKAEGGKAYPGQPTSDHTLVTIPWPVCLPEDTCFAPATTPRATTRVRPYRLSAMFRPTTIALRTGVALCPPHSRPQPPPGRPQGSPYRLSAMFRPTTIPLRRSVALCPPHSRPQPPPGRPQGSPLQITVSTSY